MPTIMPSVVTQVPAADSATALRHFESSLALETDCWDVHEALLHGPDFVLIDVRSPQAYACAHIPGAVNIPLKNLNPETAKRLDSRRAVITYCHDYQ